MLDVSDSKAEDHQYFQSIAEEMENGGLEAMYYELLHWDISKINLREAPRTKALLSQIIASFDSVQKFWFECLSRGSIKESDAEWPKQIKTQVLHREYLGFCKECYLRDKVTDSVCMKKIKTLCPGFERDRQPNGRKKRTYFRLIPTLDECRKQFEEQTGIPFDWEQD